MKSLTKTILIFLCLLLISSGVQASSVSYSTTTGMIKVYDSRGSWQSYIPVLGLTDVVVYQGSYLYASCTTNIRKFDISNAANPTMLTPWISYPANSLVIQGIYLYVGGKDLRVYSLANPKSPRLVNTRTLPSPCKVNGLEIYQNILYVATQSNGVKTFPVAA